MGWPGGRIPGVPPGPEAPPARVVLVAARDEEDRIEATVGALARTFASARIIVADSASRDETGTIAAAAGAVVVRSGPRGGKGAAMTAAVNAALGTARPADTVVLCDGDLGESAALLAPLAEAVESGRCELAVAAFRHRRGGGFGIAVGFARWAVRSLTGVQTRAPISGQRAVRAELLAGLVPFAPGFGMEVGMTADALRAGARLEEVELDLEHRATGRTAAGFAHRARQLAAFARVYAARRLRPRAPEGGAL
jgi:glycosyltransferase involved in cell wall biosynthesis